ncbi:nucleoside phosphorylase domain-containing protein [Trichoderma sp. SZMC 28013]
MPSNPSISNHGSGAQNISSGDGPQYNNNAGGIQINSGKFAEFNPFRKKVRLRGCQMDNRGDMPNGDQPRCLFDRFWDGDGNPDGRAHGDTNAYTTGQIGKHNVVLALLPSMSTASAAGAAANFRSSYSAVKLTLLVGIRGGVPGTGADEILLGDGAISRTTIQHTLGRQHPNKFVTKDTVYDNLGRTNKDIRTLISSFKTESIQERHRYSYRSPGVSEDELFAANYRYKHRASQKCKCNQETHGLLMKKVLELDDAQCPKIFVGCVASGDAVMKGIVAVEMEGAGGNLQFADGHKNKVWQPFAAATAASVMKAILGRYTLTESPSSHPRVAVSDSHV